MPLLVFLYQPFIALKHPTNIRNYRMPYSVFSPSLRRNPA